MGIEVVSNDDVLLDYYAFGCEEIKKGTNLSRLAQSMQQLELGEHVNPRYVLVICTLYRRLVVELLMFLHLQNEYASAVMMPTMEEEVKKSGGGGASLSKRGRQRKDLDKITKLFAEEKRKRAVWYDQEQQQQQQTIADEEEVVDRQCVTREEEQMLEDILSSLQTIVVVPPSSPTEGGRYG